MNIINWFFNGVFAFGIVWALGFNYDFSASYILVVWLLLNQLDPIGQVFKENKK